MKNLEIILFNSAINMSLLIDRNVGKSSNFMKQRIWTGKLNRTLFAFFFPSQLILDKLIQIKAEL